MTASSNHPFLETLYRRILVYDGAMGTNLQKMKLTHEHFGGEKTFGCNDFLVLTYPSAVEAIHRSFLEVGVDAIETNTFRSNRITLGEYGLADRVIEINRAAASLAKRLADEYSTPDHPRFVAGSIGPSGKLPSADDPDLSDISFDELVDVFREQAVGLIEGGVDVLLIETSQDILEVKAAILGIHEAFRELKVRLPIQAQVTLDTTGRMLLGTDIGAALTILAGMSIDVIGLNCSTGPEHMRQPIQYLGTHAPLPVSCLPNAGLPMNVDGEAVYPLQPQPFADQLIEFVERFGIRVVGGCCGTTAQHLQQLIEGLRRKGYLEPQLRLFQPPRFPPHLASAVRAVEVHQQPPPLLIGERCNAQGSRQFKRLLLEENYDGILELARQQVEGGAHALDVSVALTERPDEAETMRKVVKLLATGVDVPLVIDTTEPEVMEVALKTAPGRCLLNSTHLEGGEAKARRVFQLAKAFNAAVLCLTIDEQGMAKTARRKLEIAQRLHHIAVEEIGLPPESLVFDALTFTLATGDEEYRYSALETLEGIRLIKQALPGVLTSLGVSNLSFGLAAHARPILNSVMLYHAVQNGLDMAIVNPAHITPYAEINSTERQLAEDLIFARREDALARFIDYFTAQGSKVREGEKDQTAALLATMTPQQRLYWRILHRHKEGVEADIDEIIHGALNQGSLPSLAEEGNSKRPRFPSPDGGEIPDEEELRRKQHQIAVDILNTVLLPAMKEVGDRFGAGELILPFVLQSAEVMKKAVAHLEKYLEKQEGIAKGKIVLATVYGDVHDIGKNLVKTILANNGYIVIDLGKQVPAETIITTAVEQQADAIGLSALLVSTSKQMPLIVNELHRRGLKFPVLVGGAAINRRFGWRILFTEKGDIYEPGVFYCKDAFEGLAVMDQLMDSTKRQQLLQKVLQDARRELSRPLQTERTVPQVRRSSVAPQPIRLPPGVAWGPRIVRQMPLQAVFQYLFKNDLFRLSWGAKNAHGEEWEILRQEFEKRLEAMQRHALQHGWLKPQGAYGYWPCQSEGNELIIYQPDSVDNPPDRWVELMRFHFPRQEGEEYLCLADYFSLRESGILDVVAFQVVTVGQEATEYFDRLQAEGNYTEAYYVHGLAVQTAEAAAEYLHRHIRRELGLPDGQGKRYSWGYPAIPELEDHRKVFDLLPVEKELGMSLTAAFQLVPEQSTAAIVVHHPQAKYYTVGGSRVEQLMRA
ncbi:MAG: homocysteine S-methyltransferase family protein [Anaerolineales bacterium]|nr:homocysteine S-methyltransferase family protein [Anaerolineales bacterium]MCS7247407.1 homocysteine S-methyltransferase family protein [Anaerolineales bacterium]MDW8161218.1 homocysteine S-methyltransferase family protein [Anaerolineales bacterium]MDW8448252.1 homocysteine S-methyltransferase family protein [Anaerolineales bacterium]